MPHDWTALLLLAAALLVLATAAVVGFFLRDLRRHGPDQRQKQKRGRRSVPGR